MSGINHKYCSKQDHYEMDLNMICLFKECINNFLLCGMCIIKENHNTHSNYILPIKLFLYHIQTQQSQINEMIISKKDKINKENEELIKEIDNVQNSIIKELENIRKNLKINLISILTKINVFGSSDIKKEYY